MTRTEWLLIILIILQIAHILQEELARQRQASPPKLMDLLIDFATMMGDVFPYLPDSISR